MFSTGHNETGTKFKLVCNKLNFLVFNQLNFNILQFFWILNSQCLPGTLEDQRQKLLLCFLKKQKIKQDQGMHSELVLHRVKKISKNRPSHFKDLSCVMKQKCCFCSQVSQVLFTATNERQQESTSDSRRKHPDDKLAIVEKKRSKQRRAEVN